MTPSDDLEGTKVEDGFELPKQKFVVLPDPMDAHLVKIEETKFDLMSRLLGIIEISMLLLGVAALFVWVLIPLWRYFSG
jgi:hypothetical protein